MHNNQNSQQNKSLLAILGGCLLVLLCILCGGSLLLAGLLYFDRTGEAVAVWPGGNPPEASAATAVFPTVTFLPLSTIPENADTPAPLYPTPTSEPLMTQTAPADLIATQPAPTAPPTPLPISPPAAIEQRPISPDTRSDLLALHQANYPPHDYYETAIHLGKYDMGARVIEQPLRQIGERQIFNTDEGAVEAALMAITPHAYFWIENGLEVDETAVQAAADRLENEYYPQLTYLFEHEWQPGVDGDPHFSILHLQGRSDEYELGFFASQDEYPRTVFTNSNEQEMVYLNLSQLDLGSELYFGTLIHEIQHLFQWHLDKNEAAWVDEGLSQLAELFVGLDTVWPDAYLEQPEIRLNEWEFESDVLDAHYGASYLFTVYLWEQLGDEALRAFVRHPANGLSALYHLLRVYKPEMSITDWMGNWAAANYLDDLSAGSQYGYVNLDLFEPFFRTRVRQLPFEETLSIEQFGVHYIDLDYAGPVTITFAGDTLVPITDPPSAVTQDMWFLPPIDETDATLTATFDLAGLSEAELTFDTWFDLETDYDYAYVLISTDSGANWDLLYPQNGVSGEYGPGLNGRSSAASNAINGWLHETISLNRYIGQEIKIRFQVLTYFEGIGNGFALNNLAVNSGNPTTPLLLPTFIESESFSQTGGWLPQEWAIRLVRRGSLPEVLNMPLNELNQARQTVDLGAEGGALIIMPTTPFTSNPPDYWLRVE